MPKRKKKKLSLGKVVLYSIIILMVASFVRSCVRGELAGDFYTSENAEESSIDITHLAKNLSDFGGKRLPSLYHDVIYKKIFDGFSGYQSTINIILPPIGNQIDAISNIYLEVLSDHPEFFWEKNAHISQIHSIFFVSSTIKPDFLCDPSDLPSMVQQMNSVIDNIIQLANNCESDQEKALFVHDYLVANCTYDETAYVRKEIESLSYSCYGCLVNQTAVCQGYAEAYQIILNRLDIPCGRISGTASNELGIEDHSWNYIQLGDEYYMVDVTWDDPLNYYGPCRHDYFCLTEEQMGKDHFPDEGWPISNHIS